MPAVFVFDSHVFLHLHIWSMQEFSAPACFAFLNYSHGNFEVFEATKENWFDLLNQINNPTPLVSHLICALSANEADASTKVE